MFDLAQLKAAIEICLFGWPQYLGDKEPMQYNPTCLVNVNTVSIDLGTWTEAFTVRWKTAGGEWKHYGVVSKRFAIWSREIG